jgi:hypothetical protein
MDELFKDMQRQGLISTERQSLFGAKLEVNDTQLTAWKYFDGNLCLILKMRSVRYDLKPINFSKN